MLMRHCFGQQIVSLVARLFAYKETSTLRLRIKILFRGQFVPIITMAKAMETKMFSSGNNYGSL